MRRLYLLRHAKSDWGDERLDDHDRPLAPRGMRACTRMGAWLARTNGPPQLALCSSAVRAVDTLERILPHLETPPSVRIDRGLYLAAPSELLLAVGRVEDSVDTLLVVGHNPGIHALAAQLTGDGEPAAARRLARKFPTAGLAELHFPVESWSEIGASGGELLRFVTPRELADP